MIQQKLIFCPFLFLLDGSVGRNRSELRPLLPSLPISSLLGFVRAPHFTFLPTSQLEISYSSTRSRAEHACLRSGSFLSPSTSRFFSVDELELTTSPSFPQQPLDVSAPPPRRTFGITEPLLILPHTPTCRTYLSLFSKTRQLELTSIPPVSPVSFRRTRMASDVSHFFKTHDLTSKQVHLMGHSM